MAINPYFIWVEYRGYILAVKRGFPRVMARAKAQYLIERASGYNPNARKRRK